MTQLVQFANNATTTLASGITNIATSLTVQSGAGASFPALTGSQYFYCTITDAATQLVREIVKVTARSTDTFTIVRAQEGTTGTAFLTNDVVELRLTAAGINDSLDQTVTNQTTGFTITKGTTPKTLTMDADLTASNVLQSGGALGTPSSGTLTNCTGLPAAGVVGTAAVLGANTFTGQQTFAEVKDTVYTITDGAAFEIDPVNGSIQVVTLGASRTPAATNFEAGQAVLLGIDDGTAYAVTWTTVAPVWVTVGGTATAPTLATSGYTWIVLWKVGSAIYGCEVGSP